MVMYAPFLHVQDTGAVAQLVEHYVRNVGVVSSNLIRSTSFHDDAETGSSLQPAGWQAIWRTPILRAFRKRTEDKKNTGRHCHMAEVAEADAGGVTHHYNNRRGRKNGPRRNGVHNA